jgi:TRAP-type mannitol/chloroaromatic compound transport system permease small subunit
VNTAESKLIGRAWYWLALVPLVFGASRALMKYMWWAAMHSSLYGVPAEARRLREADANADFNWWMLMALAVTATIVATMLIPPFKSKSLPSSVKGMSRFVLAAVIVVGLIFVATAGMSATGYFVK